MLTVAVIFLVIVAAFAAAGTYLSLTALLVITGVLVAVAIERKVSTMNRHDESPAFAQGIISVSVVGLIAQWIAYLVQYLRS